MDREGCRRGLGLGGGGRRLRPHLLDLARPIRWSRGAVVATDTQPFSRHDFVLLTLTRNRQPSNFTTKMGLGKGMSIGPKARRAPPTPWYMSHPPGSDRYTATVE